MITKPITIKLDKVRNVRVSFNALIAMEHAGKSLLNAESWQKMSIRDVALMLFHSISHEDASLELSHVQKLLNMGNLQYVMTTLSQAWRSSMSGSAVPLEIPELA